MGTDHLNQQKEHRERLIIDIGGSDPRFDRKKSRQKGKKEARTQCTDHVTHPHYKADFKEHVNISNTANPQ